VGARSRTCAREGPPLRAAGLSALAEGEGRTPPAVGDGGRPTEP